MELEGGRRRNVEEGYPHHLLLQQATLMIIFRQVL